MNYIKTISKKRKIRSSKKNLSVVQKMIIEYPYLKKLIDKCDLEIIDNNIKSKKS